MNIEYWFPDGFYGKHIVELPVEPNQEFKVGELMYVNSSGRLSNFRAYANQPPYYGEPPPYGIPPIFGQALISSEQLQRSLNDKLPVVVPTNGLIWCKNYPYTEEPDIYTIVGKGTDLSFFVVNLPDKNNWDTTAYIEEAAITFLVGFPIHKRALYDPTIRAIGWWVLVYLRDRVRGV